MSITKTLMLYLILKVFTIDFKLIIKYINDIYGQYARVKERRQLWKKKR